MRLLANDKSEEWEFEAGDGDEEPKIDGKRVGFAPVFFGGSVGV